MQIIDIEQGTAEWLALRRTKITATDANVIMGVDPWKTKTQLFNDKINNTESTKINPAMLRGKNLEETARQLYNIKTGRNVSPKVVVRDWQMASLDGLSECGKYALEIKCPGKKDHEIALRGLIPEKYIPQLIHIMFVCGLTEMDYFSFDGIDGVIVHCSLDSKYLEKMLEKQLEFYNCLKNKTIPQVDEDEFRVREDDLWIEYARQYKEIIQKMKELEMQEQLLKSQLIYYSGSHNSTGGGITMSKIKRIGSIDYSKVPELEFVDLEKYRKETTAYWKIDLK